MQKKNTVKLYVHYKPVQLLCTNRAKSACVQIRNVHCMFTGLTNWNRSSSDNAQIYIYSLRDNAVGSEGKTSYEIQH